MTYPVLDFQPQAFFALGSPIALFNTVMDVSVDSEYVLPNCANFFNIFHPYDPVAYRFEPLIDPFMAHVDAVLIPHYRGRKRLHLKAREKVYSSIKWLRSMLAKVLGVFGTRSDAVMNEPAMIMPPINVGKLNGGKRIDYALQEAPLESINEYLFSITSHLIYWESKDTMLMILTEIYKLSNVLPDSVKANASASSD